MGEGAPPRLHVPATRCKVDARRNEVDALRGI